MTEEPRPDESLVAPIPVDFRSAHEELARFETKLGVKRAEGLIQSREALLAEAKKPFDQLARELIALQDRYQGQDCAYKVRYPHDYIKEICLTHLPLSLPDGSHVVLQTLEGRERTGPLHWLPKKLSNPRRVREIAVAVVAPDEVNTYLLQNNLKVWFEEVALGSNNLAQELEKFRDVWGLYLVGGEIPSVHLASHQTEELAILRDVVLEDSTEPIKTEVVNIFLERGVANVAGRSAINKEGGWTWNGVIWECGLDGPNLVRAGQKREEGMPYVDFAKGISDKLEAVLKEAGV